MKNYLLFYVVREDESAVYVIRFLYAKRAWQNILRAYVKKKAADLCLFLQHITFRKMWKSMGSDILI